MNLEKMRKQNARGWPDKMVFEFDYMKFMDINVMPMGKDFERRMKIKHGRRFSGVSIYQEEVPSTGKIRITMEARTFKNSVQGAKPTAVWVDEVQAFHRSKPSILEELGYGPYPKHLGGGYDD